jgi:F0F1-type ATP synthase delta subunit
MATLSRRRVARELVRLLIAHPERRNGLLLQAAAYMVHHKQVNQLHLFVNDIADELSAQQKHVSADVITAFGLTTDLRGHVVELLKQVTGAKTVALTETVDPSLLGGVVIRTPQLELDASVKRRLNQLAGGIK